MLEQLVQSLEVVANHEADLEDIVGLYVCADAGKVVIEGVFWIMIESSWGQQGKGTFTLLVHMWERLAGGRVMVHEFWLQ